MRLISKIVLSAVIAISLSACGESKKYISDSTGKINDVMAVMPENQWKGALGDTLRAIMRESVEMFITQEEPKFDLYYTTPKGFSKSIISSSRNVIRFGVGSEYKSPSMFAEYDVYSRPQLVVNVVGPSVESVASYMSQHKKELQNIFTIAERDRFADWAVKYADPTVNRVIREKFGFKMSMPKGYAVRNAASPDFLWASFEQPLVSQGVIIYSYPYEGEEPRLSTSKLLASRNEFVKRIPGPSDGSFMTTSPYVMPDVRAIELSGRLWFEMNGYWDVQNDFMGGPFVSYTTVDTANERVLTIDFYVYSPKHPKRNYMQQLEFLMATVDLDRQE